MLCMTEKLLNSSVKQPLGVSPNTLLFGNAFHDDTSLLSQIDRDISNTPTQSIRDYVDTLVARQSKLIEAAIASQRSINEDNLRRRYAHYPRISKLHLPKPPHDGADNQSDNHNPTAISHILTNLAPPHPPILSAVKWILHRNPITGVDEFIKVVQSEQEIVDTISEIDIETYLHTTYQVNDYVLRRYPPTKLGGGNPNKYGSWWRGPYQVMSVIQKPVSDTLTKPRYTIRNLVTGKEYMADVTHLRPFYFDPNYVTPLNIAVKDTDEHVVEKIVAHDFSNFNDKRWLVQWSGTEAPDQTWETYETLKDVEAFHHYCAALQLDPFPPSQLQGFSASRANIARLPSHSLPLPVPPKQTQSSTHTTTPTNKKRGRPRKVQYAHESKDA